MSDVNNQKISVLNLKQKAEIYLSQGKLDEAYATCSKALEILPNSGEIYVILGNILQKMGKLKSSKEYYEIAIKYNPNIAEAYANLGSIFAIQKEWELAIKYYDIAITIKPKISGFYRNLAKIWHHLGKHQLAIEFSYKAFSLEPESATVKEYLEFGKNLLKIGKLEQATTCLITALQIKPDYVSAYHQIAKILEQQNDIDAALKCRFSKRLPKNLLKNFCQLTENWEVTSNSTSTIDRINIYPSRQINLLPSQTINRNLHRVFSASLVNSEEAFVAILLNGRAWGDNLNSAIITSDNKLVSDISSGVPELIISSSRLPFAVPIDGTIAFLSVKWGHTNYFHWMFDVVIRIHLLRQSNLSIDKFVFSRCDLPFQQETIQLLGISQNQIIESRFLPHIKAEKLLVPSLSSPQGKNFRFPRFGCEFLRSLFLPTGTKKISLNNKKMIYISRKETSSRRIVNEAEVVICLEKLGFQTITLELMSVAQQASLLANSKVIVAPHGAGLTNLVFCAPGTKVIEIFHREYVINYYWLLSNVCGLEHYHLIGDEFERDFSGKPAQKDILVNLQKLLDLMKLVKII